MTGWNFSLILNERLKGSDNGFNLQGETTFLEENFSFLSTGSFYQTLRKFNHQTFKKGLIQKRCASFAERNLTVLKKQKEDDRTSFSSKFFKLRI